MSRFRRSAGAVIGIGLLLALVGAVRSEDSSADDAVARLAAEIDAHIARRWAAEQVRPTDLSDDAEFMRRVTLDIAGKIPAVADLHEFLDDTAPDKRRKLVDRLLDSPAYIMNFSNVWRSVMMPEAEADLQVRFLVPAFEAWLRKRLTDNATYDTIVREILTVTVDPRNAMNPYQQQGDVTPVSFYQAKQLKPENLAAGTARIFLGVRIECAQCHNHPFDDWKREQFWGYAAFFAGMERDINGQQQGVLNSIRELFDRRELVIPGTGQLVKPAYLDGTQPKLKLRESARGTLADWMVSGENPYFTKAAANRLWGHFFGLGIVNPVDDFTADNPPSHPELLDLLAREFAANKFDVKFLIRAITASHAYQLSSRQTDPGQENPRLFARMSLKGLTPEQLFDSIAQATGYYEPYANRDPFAMQNNSPRTEFIQTFDNSRDAVIEQQTTILQALALMNGQFVSDATSLEKSA
ncbi:MAG TPA: DUF1549 and DUF1553 domain-containing protein, partial [Planctomycetaceae bacterium]|nr:DUF1549 and DUF1553 domain-containing protein [Planctomycetaceae bacterium]